MKNLAKMFYVLFQQRVRVFDHGIKTRERDSLLSSVLIP